MFVQWTHINVEELGKCSVRVECTNCGCQYYYTLIRICVRSTRVLYSIGAESATRSAREKAIEELDRRLESEAELVPCPKCHWINESLIEGYRRACYRSAGAFAKVFAFIGVCILLVYAYWYYADPAGARTVLANFFVAAPALFWLIALAMVGLGRYLRGQIQPNRYFPQPPKLPARRSHCPPSRPGQRRARSGALASPGGSRQPPLDQFSHRQRLHACVVLRLLARGHGWAGVQFTAHHHHAPDHPALRPLRATGQGNLLAHLVPVRGFRSGIARRGWFMDESEFTEIVDRCR